MAKHKKTAKKGQLEKGKNAIFFSLRWKLLIGFTVLFSVFFAAAFIWFLNFSTQQALNRIQDDLLSTLEGASMVVDGDTLASLAQDGTPNAAGEAWLEVSNAEENESPDLETLRAEALADYGEGTPTGFSDDPRYQELMDQLQIIHNIEPRAWPYLYVKASGEREITYIADLWARYDPSKATPFLFTRTSKRSYNGLNELTRRLDDNGEFNTYTDEWGQWLSAYTPVKNSAGENVGAVGIDFEADYVKDVQDAIRSRIIVAFVVANVGLFLLVFFISLTLTRPIQKLTISAENLGEGDYNQDMSQYQSSTFFKDEIVRLADVFAIMADKVYQREQNLRRQVETLRIEIDEAKKQRQVNEIADTDFFRDLQTKAQNMRKRRSGQG